MHAPSERPAQRKDEVEPGTWTAALFSPVLKFFGTEEEGGEGSPGSVGGGAGGAGGGGSAAAAAPVPATPAKETHDDLPHSSEFGATPAGVGRGEEGDEDYEFDFEEFNPYLFMKLLPDYSLVAPARPRIVLPKKSRKAPLVSLVLDLDETLVHCSVDPIPDADLTFGVEFNGANYMVYVRKRPFLDRFLELVYEKFEVTVFTASQRVYAEKLLDLLDTEKKYIKYRLYRDSCLNVEGNYLKDLNVLGRDLKHTVLVDNSPHAFGYQVDNGIPIESWFDDPKDTELLKLASFLDTLTSVADVRAVLRERFNVQGLINRAGHDARRAGSL